MENQQRTKITTIEEYESCLNEIQIQLQRLGDFKEELKTVNRDRTKIPLVVNEDDNYDGGQQASSSCKEKEEEAVSTKNEDGFLAGDYVQVRDKIFLYGRHPKKWPKGEKHGKIEKVLRVTKEFVWLGDNGTSEYRKKNNNVTLVRGVDGSRFVKLPDGKLFQRW